MATTQLSERIDQMTKLGEVLCCLFGKTCQSLNVLN